MKRGYDDGDDPSRVKFRKATKKSVSYRTKKRWAAKGAFEFSAFAGNDGDSEIKSSSNSSPASESDASSNSSFAESSENSEVSIHTSSNATAAECSSGISDGFQQAVCDHSNDRAHGSARDSCSSELSIVSTSNNSRCNSDESGSSASTGGDVEIDELVENDLQIDMMDNFHVDVFIPSEKLYNGEDSKNVDEAVYLLLNSYIKHHKSNSCLQEDLNNLKLLLPQSNRLPKSLHRLFAYVINLTENSKVITYYCCKSCSVLHGTQKVSICNACSSDIGCNLFYTFDVISHLKFFFEHRNLKGVLDRTSAIRNSDSNIFRDITDGSEYKRVNASKNPYDLTLVLSTDGACLKSSSKANLWVISFSIAEVPLVMRRVFTAPAAVWYADQKPEMNSFFQPISLHLRENFDKGGFSWEDPDSKETFITKASAPHLIADAPARAMSLNTLFFNGKFGCNICEIKTRKIKKIGNERRVRVYKYISEGSQLQTKHRMNLFGRLAEERNHPIKGVKGRSILSILPGADLSTMTTPEVLHSVCLGVIKQVTTLWIEKPKICNLKNHLRDIDTALLEIKPTDQLCRIPRKLSDVKHWKGYEFLYWALFYSLTIIGPFLEDKYVQHWMMFVIALNILFQSEIKLSDLDEAEMLLNLFVEQFEGIYGERNMSYNLHQMTHLCLCVKRWGPLLETSAFGPEDFIGSLGNLVHGSKHIGKEIVHKIKITEGFYILKNRTESKIPARQDCFVTKGKPVKLSFSEEEQYLVDSVSAGDEDVKIYSKVEIKKNVFTSKLYKNVKTINYCVHFKTSENSGMYGFIRYFIALDNTLFIMIDPLAVDHQKMMYHTGCLPISRNGIPGFFPVFPVTYNSFPGFRIR